MTAAALPPHVGIVGLGLMGGSLARDLVARGVRVSAYDNCPDPAWQLPQGLCLVRSALAVAEAPVIVLAVPVKAAEDLLSELRPRVTERHTILDVGSTKANLTAHAGALGIGHRFVGCHPFAGDHRSGWNASRTGLFAGATVFVCPTPNAASDAVQVATTLWSGVGGVVAFDNVTRHDERMAQASHLPHLLSVTLALALRDAAIPHRMLGPGGRDVARLAGGSPEMWMDIVAQNRVAILNSLTRYEQRLTRLREAVALGDDVAVGGMLSAGRAWHDGATSG